MARNASRRPDTSQIPGLHKFVEAEKPALVEPFLLNVVGTAQGGRSAASPISRCSQELQLPTDRSTTDCLPIRWFTEEAYEEKSVTHAHQQLMIEDGTNLLCWLLGELETKAQTCEGHIEADVARTMGHTEGKNVDSTLTCRRSGGSAQPVPPMGRKLDIQDLPNTVIHGDGCVQSGKRMAPQREVNFLTTAGARTLDHGHRPASPERVQSSKRHAGDATSSSPRQQGRASCRMETGSTPSARPQVDCRVPKAVIHLPQHVQGHVNSKQGIAIAAGVPFGDRPLSFIARSSCLGADGREPVFEASERKQAQAAALHAGTIGTSHEPTMGLQGEDLGPSQNCPRINASLLNPSSAHYNPLAAVSYHIDKELKAKEGAQKSKKRKTQFKSSLTEDEHKMLLDPENLSCFGDAELMQRLRIEQEAHTLLQQHLILDDMDPYQTRDPVVMSCVEHVLGCKRAQVRNYPQYYKLNWTFPLAFPCKLGAIPNMWHVSDLSPERRAPTAHAVPSGTSIVQAARIQLHDDSSKLRFLSVMKDEDAIACAEAIDASIVMSDAALGCLVALSTSGQAASWEIPFVVKSGPDGQACVYMDEPLLGRSLNPRQKDELYFQRALVMLSAPAGSESHQASPLNLSSSGDVIAWRHYCHCCLGDTNIVVQCQDCLQDPSGRRVSVRAKMEHLWAFRKEMLEEYTFAEMARWWTDLLLRPGSTVWVCRVAAQNGVLLKTEVVDIESFPHLVPKIMTFERNCALQNLRGLLDHLKTLDSGSYLLTHGHRDSSLCCFKAVPSNQSAGSALAPLPINVPLVSSTIIYDLHKAHEQSGSTDAEISPFVPPQWVPRSGFTCVPHTFPPLRGQSKCRQKVPCGNGLKAQVKKGKRKQAQQQQGPGGQQHGEQPPREVRPHGPSVAQDWPDERPLTLAPGVTAQVGVDKYMRMLEEEL
ncbi:unnamed protein product [Ostreobium quekettii]|uniref:Little elongation complex subunit 2 C-terminal domain-containing protein n=1 Tax=Ostreobium quekettii TaxID=121088 RepID=A0A8S1J5M5_9CHLO|nr:unnamed protein product [Ostreobium quekettii]|eukprot:evm.model.scf_736EXC.3 EVM.evm.TU.scf_736EXC.3   scf_736EXC:16758-22019(-)